MDLIEIKISRYPRRISGVKFFETEELLFIIDNPVDYILDGLLIINKKYIKQYSFNKKDKLKSIIFQKKVEALTINSNIKTDSMKNIIHTLCNNDVLIEIGLDSQEYSLIGKILSVDKKDFIINLLSIDAVFIKTEKILIDRLRIISIETDYLNSLSIVL